MNVGKFSKLSGVETQFDVSFFRHALFHLTLRVIISRTSKPTTALSFHKHIQYIHTNTQDACSGNDSLSV